MLTNLNKGYRGKVVSTGGRRDRHSKIGKGDDDVEGERKIPLAYDYVAGKAECFVCHNW